MGKDFVPVRRAKREGASTIGLLTEDDQNFLLIEEPPSTGKTTALVAIVRAVQSLRDKASKVVVCTPSNSAIDMIGLPLIKQQLELTRVGVSSKVNPKLSVSKKVSVNNQVPTDNLVLTILGSSYQLTGNFDLLIVD